MGAESRLRDLGLVLPRAVQLLPGVELPFSWVRVHGRRVLVSGHGPLAEDSTPAGPFGSVPADVSAADATHSARLTALAVLAGVRRAVGDPTVSVRGSPSRGSSTPNRATTRRPRCSTGSPR